MLEFQLFRIQIYPSQQLGMFEPIRTPAQVLTETVVSYPSAELRRGMIWHVGNVSKIDENSLYFRVGRTTKATIEIYKNGNFEEMEFEQAPYTHVILDIPMEICAIAKKIRLAAKTYGIASNLAHLLTESEKATELRARFGIGTINDPTDFITFLQRAIAVQRLWVTFSLPNAWDANEDIEKPLERALREINGKNGKVEFAGDNLKTKELEDFLRSTASRGNDAGASLLIEEEKKLVRKRIVGNPIIINQEEIDLEEQRKNLITLIRKAYKKVRGAND